MPPFLVVFQFFPQKTLNELPRRHFRVLSCLSVKTSLSTKPFLWNVLCFYVNHLFMKIKLILITQFLHEDFFQTETKGNSEMAHFGLKVTFLMFMVTSSCWYTWRKSSFVDQFSHLVTWKCATLMEMAAHVFSYVLFPSPQGTYCFK